MSVYCEIFNQILDLRGKMYCMRIWPMYDTNCVNETPLPNSDIVQLFSSNIWYQNFYNMSLNETGLTTQKQWEKKGLIT